MLLLSLILMLMTFKRLFGQSAGDYRSYQSGIWNSVNNWERYNGTSWVYPASSVPSSSDGIITIKNGHNIEISSSVTIDQVVIEAGGTINWTGGTITINDGSGDDLIIYGTFRHNKNGTVPGGSGTISVESDGEIRIDNGGNSDCDFYASNENITFSSRMKWKNNAIFNWANTSLFSTSGLTYFPDVGESVIPVFKVTGNNTFYVGAGASNPTVIKGIFEVNSPAIVYWQNGGTKTFRNGIKGNGNIFQRSGTNTCGQFKITGTAELSGSGGLTINANGLSVENNSTLTVKENKTISVNASSNPLSIESGSKIEINPGVTLTFNGTLSNSAGNSGILLKSDNTGTGNLIHNTQNVAGTVERYLTGSTIYKPYHFICSPIKNAPFSNIWTSGDYNVYYYDETNTDTSRDVGWTRILSGNLTNGKGYAIVSNYADRTLNFAGSLMVPADISSQIAVTYTSSGNSAADGWNLVGNPYPCALDITEFINDNTSNLDNSYGAVYLWDDVDGTISRQNDYATCNKAGGTPANSAAPGNSSNTPNGKIAVGQGFFVKIKSSASYLSFDADQRISNSSSQFFIPDTDANIKRIRLAVSGPDSLYNETLIAFLSDATEGHDPFYDAVKLKGNPYIALFSKINGIPDDYAIQSLNDGDFNTVIPIGLNAGLNGEYTFFLKNLENFPDDFSVFFTDIINGITTELNKNSYKLNLKKGSYDSRFFIHFNPVLSEKTSELAKNNISFRVSEKIVYLSFPIEFNITEIQVYDLNSKKIKTVYTKNQNYASIDLSFYPNGIYIAQLISPSSNYHKKFIIKN